MPLVLDTAPELEDMVGDDAEVDAEAEANGGESQMADIADKDPKVPTS